MFWRIVRRFVKPALIDILTGELADKLADTLNEKLDLPFLNEEQEKAIIDICVDTSMDVVADFVEEI